MNLNIKAAIAVAIILLAVSLQSLKAQSGPWARYNGKMKGEALVRDSDGGYLKEVQSIVEGGGDVNWQLESGFSPLMAAAGGGHLEIVKFLIEKGADPNLKDSNGRTALDRAQLAGANDVVRYLRSLATQPVSAQKTDNQTVVIQPATAPAPAEMPATPPPVANNGTATPPAVAVIPAGKWPVFGTYKVGDRVKFFAGSWKSGTIVEVGVPGDNTGKLAAPKERRYLIGREGAANWNDWTDWGNVTGLTREPFWTSFFNGEWRLGETMAANTRVEGGYQRDEYTFHKASEALQVKSDNSYSWKTIGGKVINGTWRPAEDGAGIILINAYQGINWTLRNETNSTEENIRGLQTSRLTADGKMSIKAQRPIQ
ncbi:ankyrin repeat domain-containing protein [Daejeonella lutea]|uniref:Ankyrin repeat-containing protein n=1 Tax=Daejeonella lutea TaxID=572036 RepID=A0A1T5ET78_9SPHI|nr:ankyrin repeat domain-containing protein [Daejeonella lutea]SKB87132.1 Ankyrin repeat-containing protein [Daejeonella lutea]